jgi:hypothetical protein
MRSEQIDEAAIERLIGQVRGVIGARVVCDAQGGIAEIHVVAAPYRSAKQMVRDIESLIYVRGGLRVDHRKISLAQLAEPDLPVLARQIRLVDVKRSADVHEITIGVTLVVGDQQVQGLGHGRHSLHQPAWLAGEATIHALNQLLGVSDRLRLVDLRFQPFGEIEVCLAQLADAEGAAVLLGMSAAHDDTEMTAARAVLDALGHAPHYAVQRTLAHGASA